MWARGTHSPTGAVEGSVFQPPFDPVSKIHAAWSPAPRGMEIYPENKGATSGKPGGFLEISRGVPPPEPAKASDPPRQGCWKVARNPPPLPGWGNHAIFIMRGGRQPMKTRSQTLFGNAAVFETPFRSPARMWPIAVQGNRVSKTSAIPNRVWERERKVIVVPGKLVNIVAV